VKNQLKVEVNSNLELDLRDLIRQVGWENFLVLLIKLTNRHSGKGMSTKTNTFTALQQRLSEVYLWWSKLPNKSQVNNKC
jgi:hypothetical protein